jgi:DNA-binding transcriptional LysR family regulator
MTLAQLTSFVEIARRLSFRRAAEYLRLAQPSVSAHIRDLERELGVPLFERLGRRVRLTEAGLALLPHAEHILISVDDARAAVEAVSAVPQGMLALGTTPSLVGTLVPPIVHRLQVDAPHVQLRLTISVSDTVVDEVHRGDVDLGIAYLARSEPSVTSARILDDEFILIVAPGHPLAHRDAISIHDLEHIPIIGLQTGTVGYKVVDRELTQRSIHPEILMEMESSDAIKGMVAAGVAPAIVSRQAVNTELRTGIVHHVPFSDATIRHPIVALTRSTRAITGPLLAGLRAIHAVYASAEA